MHRVYDGVNSYRLSSTVILKSPIKDLSPFYFVLGEENSFVKNYKSLYLEVFNVIPELTPDLCVDLINVKCSSATDLSLANSTLIRSVYDFIENKQSCLINIGNLLPVHNLAPNNTFSAGIAFECIEKSVYLNDDQNDTKDEFLSYKLQTCREKDFKICNDNKLISRRFLKKLGVRSFTERVMNIESLESYGQHEDLTDRLSRLLNGYKDGINIFKEIIQVCENKKIKCRKTPLAQGLLEFEPF